MLIPFVVRLINEFSSILNNNKEKKHVWKTFGIVKGVSCKGQLSALSNADKFYVNI